MIMEHCYTCGKLVETDKPELLMCEECLALDDLLDDLKSRQYWAEQRQWGYDTYLPVEDDE